MKNKFNRRDFCHTTLLSSMAFALPGSLKDLQGLSKDNNKATKGPLITDTFIHLFDWPFRELKYSDTGELVDKLKHHSIGNAWAGNFEALFHKDIDGTNRRLTEECRKIDPGFLNPVGSVNTTWPDWEEDLRRCDENYKMAGIRIHPLYQMIDLSSTEFKQLVEKVTKRGMFIQIAGDLEDFRHHHPLVEVRSIPFGPILDVAKAIPGARIQMVHWNRQINGNLLNKLVDQTNIVFDTSRIEGAGELGGLIEGDSWYGPDQKISANRFLFGSHAPFFAVESALLKLFEHPLEEDQLRMVMIQNAEKFIDA